MQKQYYKCAEYDDVFTGIGCLKDTFSLQVKYDVKPYHVPLRHVSYTPPGAIKRIRKTILTTNHSTNRDG